ncbi:P-type conjugative transfer protein TrbL [Vibrio parahaemolyticus]|nr:P-type conjugative transfer protein TrbL [Vibrio parahaemolyticus]EJG1127869.1 P-type conjugative transfer protein TrbL [Vibrio parahaemolyticus]
MVRWFMLMSILFSQSTFAATDNSLDQILDKFKVITANWEPVIVSAVTGLFWLLVTLSFTWGAIQLWIKQQGITEFVAFMFERAVIIGLSVFLVKNAVPLAWVLVNSFQEVASRISGVSGSFSPSNIIDLGITIAQRVWESSSGFDVGEMLIIGISGLIVVVVLALVAAQLTVLIVGSYILINGGVVMMGLMGSEWTRQYSLNYFTTILGLSVQIFIMQLLVIVGNDMFMSFINIASDGASDYLIMVAMSVIYYALISTVPNMATSLTTGQFNFNAAGAVNAAAGVAGASAGLGLAGATASKMMGGKLGSALANTKVGQNLMSHASQFMGSSPKLQSVATTAGKMAKPVMSAVGGISHATMNAMAQQSSVGRAFRDLAASSTIPNNAHEQIMKALQTEINQPSGMTPDAAAQQVMSETSHSNS